jgi:hypothetical protein
MEPTREELLRFVAEATEYAGSFAAQLGDTMPWTGARKARSERVYRAGRELLGRAAKAGTEPRWDDLDTLGPLTSRTWPG